MTKDKAAEIKHFILYYGEINYQLDLLLDEAMDYSYNHEETPESLSKEIYRHELLLNILTQVSKEKYKKSPEILTRDFFDNEIMEVAK